jgi:predicted amidohydrolase YtcJ
METYPRVERILHNGRFYTMDSLTPFAEAVALGGGRILAVGSDSDVLALARPGTETVDLRGATVVPGLVDGHVHFTMYVQTTQVLFLDGIASLQGVLERVHERAKGTPEGGWIRGFGYNRNLWPGQAFPTRTDLDSVASHHPVFIVSKDGHSCWANSAALRAAGISRDTPDPVRGVIQRDATTKEPTGILLENAGELVDKVIPPTSQDEALDATRHAIRKAHAVGLTGVHSNEGAEAFALFGALRARGELPFRVVHSIPRERLDEAMAAGIHSGLGDEWLRIGGVKLFTDGSLGSRTAWMNEPFDGEPDNRGIPVVTPEELRELVLKAAKAGLASWIHAIGDAATHLCVDVLAGARKVQSDAFPPLRHRVEHAQLLSAADVGRMAEHDIIASMQPLHATSDYEMIERYWGARGKGAYCFRTLLSRGVRMAFGSDCPVEVFDPLVSIHAAVTRRRGDGAPGPDGWHPDERLTVAEAVYAYTMGNAYAVGLEGRMGSITAGKVADLTVLSDDIFSIEPMRILDAKVLATWVGGEAVYRA